MQADKSTTSPGLSPALKANRNQLIVDIKKGDYKHEDALDIVANVEPENRGWFLNNVCFFGRKRLLVAFLKATTDSDIAAVINQTSANGMGGPCHYLAAYAKANFKEGDADSNLHVNYGVMSFLLEWKGVNPHVGDGRGRLCYEILPAKFMQINVKNVNFQNTWIQELECLNSRIFKSKKLTELVAVRLKLLTEMVAVRSKQTKPEPEDGAATGGGAAVESGAAASDSAAAAPLGVAASAFPAVKIDHGEAVIRGAKKAGLLKGNYFPLEAWTDEEKLGWYENLKYLTNMVHIAGLCDSELGENELKTSQKPQAFVKVYKLQESGSKPVEIIFNDQRFRERILLLLNYRFACEFPGDRPDYKAADRFGIRLDNLQCLNSWRPSQDAGLIYDRGGEKHIKDFASSLSSSAVRKMLRYNSSIVDFACRYFNALRSSMPEFSGLDQMVIRSKGLLPVNSQEVIFIGEKDCCIIKGGFLELYLIDESLQKFEVEFEVLSESNPPCIKISYGQVALANLFQAIFSGDFKKHILPAVRDFKATAVPNDDEAVSGAAMSGPGR